MNFFKLKEHGTSVKQELSAGFTTFLTMIYIIPVSAAIMSQAGMPMEAIVTATALITIFSTILNGLWANTPVAMSVGMGLIGYFTFGLVIGAKIPWETALGIVFLSGIIFLILCFTNFRMWVLKSIPMDLRRAISAGIGSFICFIGLQQMGIIVHNDAVLVGLGDFSNPSVLLGLFGLICVLIFWSLNIKGAFILAVLVTSVVAWVTGLSPYPEKVFSLPASITPIFFKLDIIGAFSLAFLPAIVTFFITDLFDSLGTLSGIGSRINLFDESTKEGTKKLEKTLETDAVATVVGSIVGVSTTTSFAESSSGVEDGGRTGLTAVFTGLFFILTLFLFPIFKAIPSNAIYPVLFIVGVLMFSELSKVNFNDKATSVAVFSIVVLIPLTYSITTGLAFGFIFYFFIKLVTRQFKDINLGIVILALISFLSFVVRYI